VRAGPRSEARIVVSTLIFRGFTRR
jgi:hypothetical protein